MNHFLEMQVVQHEGGLDEPLEHLLCGKRSRSLPFDPLVHVAYKSAGAMDITSGTVSHDNVDTSVVLAIVVIANNEFMSQGGQDLDLERDLLHFFRWKCPRIDLFENIVIL